MPRLWPKNQNHEHIRPANGAAILNEVRIYKILELIRRSITLGELRFFSGPDRTSGELYYCLDRPCSFDRSFDYVGASQALLRKSILPSNTFDFASSTGRSSRRLNTWHSKIELPGGHDFHPTE
jgi:hypothetical protein